MKIAITGHTRGIGLAAASRLSNHTIVGLCRSNGFDIKNTNLIIDTIKDCDVFINNAYFDNCQEILLRELYKLWKDTNKAIINIGSCVTAYPRIEADRDSEPWDYRDNKLTLQKTFRELSWQSLSCHLALINPGATDTDMIKLLSCKKLDPNTVASVIESVLFNKHLKEITIYEK